MTVHYIYALADPRTSEKRYVGQVHCSRTKRRMREHVARAARGEDTYRARWIRKILAAGLEPIMLLIERATRTRVDARERFWIRELKGQGARLTNCGDGGGSLLGYRHTDEARQKMSLALKGKPKSAAHRRAISEAAKTRTISPAYREAHRLAMLGRRQSPEAIAKTAAAHRGSKRSAVARQRMSDAAKRRKYKGR